MLEKSKKSVRLQEILFWHRRTDTGLLASIETTGEKSAFSQKIIQNIVGIVDDTICAKEYPLARSEYLECISKKFTLASEYRVRKKWRKAYSFSGRWNIFSGKNEVGLAKMGGEKL